MYNPTLISTTLNKEDFTTCSKKNHFCKYIDLKTKNMKLKLRSDIKINLKSVFNFLILLSDFSPIILCLYSLTCIQWSTLVQRKNNHIRQLTAHLRSVHPDCHLQYIMICILMLLERNLMGGK